MGVIHFAYGSNLCLPRLRSRVPGVCFIGRATLAGYVLRWHKKSRHDGSGKLSIVRSDSSSASVEGALFAIPDDEKQLLDRAEGLGHGYNEEYLTVLAGGHDVTAQTYVADASYIDESLKPCTWYRDLVADGAEALGFAESYVAMLRSVEAIEDTDPKRETRERAFLPCCDPGRGDFLRAEFQRLAMLAALQRSRTYAKGASDAARAAFRADLEKRLDLIAANYGRPVSDDRHNDAIRELSEQLSAAHSPTLTNHRLRIGVTQKALNLFLKYLWCAGRIAMPPHCPFDSVIMRRLPPSQRVAWTKIDALREYEELVANARLVAGGEPLALWELRTYAQLTRRSGQHL